MSKKGFYSREARQKMPYLVHFYPIFHQNQSFFQKTNSKSSKLQGFWINSRALGKNSRIWRKNSSFLASKLNKPVVTNYTRYHKSVEKKACPIRLEIKNVLKWSNLDCEVTCRGKPGRTATGMSRLKGGRWVHIPPCPEGWKVLSLISTCIILLVSTFHREFRSIEDWPTILFCADMGRILCSCRQEFES